MGILVTIIGIFIVLGMMSARAQSDQQFRDYQWYERQRDFDDRFRRGIEEDRRRSERQYEQFQEDSRRRVQEQMREIEETEMKDLMETCAELGFQVIGFDEEGVFEMRPAEIIFGGPIGAIEVRWGVNDADGAYGLVECYNGATKKSTFLKVDSLTAVSIDNWIQAGKPGNIQDVFPDLTAEQREQLLSGITPEEWNEMFSEGEDDD